MSVDLLDVLSRSLGVMLVEGLESRTAESDFREDPVGFARERLGMTLWKRQEDVLRAVAEHDRVVVEAGHGVGKTVAASLIVAWWMSTRESVMVVTMAPTFNQVQNQLWEWIRRLDSRVGLPGRVYRTPFWRTDWGIALGISPDKKKAHKQSGLGYHAENLLVVLDEAGGLPLSFWQAAENLVTGEGNKILAIGNPLEQGGPFFDKARDPGWYHLRISCLEHPNVVEGRNVIPGAVSRRWVEDMIRRFATPVPDAADTPPGAFFWQGKWYLPGPVFESRVLGRPPAQSENQLISMRWVEEARNRYVPPEGRWVLALDVASTGDDASVLCMRAGRHVAPLRRRYKNDTVTLARWVMAVIGELGGNVREVWVDAVGVGIGVVDQLRRFGVPVREFWGQGAASVKTYANRRTEVWFRLRDALREGLLDIPDDDLLADDLLAVRFEASEPIQLERKEKIRQRIGRSPDSGDALAMTFASESLTGVNRQEEVEKVEGGELWVDRDWGVSAAVRRWTRESPIHRLGIWQRRIHT